MGVHLEFRFVPIVPLHAFELVEEHMRHMMLFQGLIHDLFIVDLVPYGGADDRFLELRMHLSSWMASFMIRRFAQASSACSN